MKLCILSSLLFLGWSGTAFAGDDGFSAVPGTGWTDIRELQSTCATPGYFTNPADCTKFYVCVDHSTPENKLLLRYDFDCPGGLAFDESTSNCNYPGPSGCVEGGGGGWQPGGGGGGPGWQPGSGGSGSGSGSGWQPGGGGSSSGGGGWGSENNNGWGWKKPGLFQSTSTVNRLPTWGGGQVSTQTISRGGPAVGRTVFVGPSPTTIPANPRVSYPSTTIVHIPATQWESQRITPLNNGVFQSVKTNAVGQGWSSQTTKVVNSGTVIQGGRVSTPSNPSVAWGQAQILPVDTGAVFQSARVTPVPQAQWEIPKSFPPVQTTVIEQPSGGWGSSSVRFPSPSPTPQPANPLGGPGVIYTVTSQPITWQAPTPSPAFQATKVSNAQVPTEVFFRSTGTRVSPTPQPLGPVSFQSTKVTSQSQAPTGGVVFQSARLSPTPQPFNGWQSVRVEQPSNPQVNVVQSSGASAANPTLQIPAPPGGWDNVRLTQLPSGYIWQSNSISKASPQQEVNNFVTSGPSQGPPIAYQQQAQTIQSAGNFGIVQQVINEQQGQSGEDGKSTIQFIYETKEKQQQAAQAAGQVLQQQQALVQTTNQVQGQDPVGPTYEIIASPGSDSLPKGRIIVLYAPLSKNGAKREAPVIEVEVEEGDDDESDLDNSK